MNLDYEATDLPSALYLQKLLGRGFVVAMSHTTKVWTDEFGDRIKEDEFERYIKRGECTSLPFDLSDFELEGILE